MAYADNWQLLKPCAAVETTESVLLRHTAILFMAGILTAVPRHIGMVTADGRLWVDSAGVSNHATIFEGSVVQTEQVPAKLRLTGGASLWLDVASRADVFQDHLLLEKGRAQLDGGAVFRIEAKTLRVALASPESRATVSLQDSGAVQVGALNGEVQVRNGQGVMVARVDRGRPVELRLDSSGGSMVTGCVSRLGKSAALQDEASGVTVELRSKELSNYIGKRIQVTGVTADSSATTTAEPVIEARAVKVLGTGCTPALNAAGAAATGSRERAAPISSGTAGGASGASAGISAPAAVLGGVAVASGSAAAAHAIIARKKPKPPISRGRR